MNLSDVNIQVMVRVVEAPLDPVYVHLVCETIVQRPGTTMRRLVARGVVDYRSPTTICGITGYTGTDRKEKACAACANGVPQASIAARMTTRAQFSIRESTAQTNGRGHR